MVINPALSQAGWKFFTTGVRKSNRWLPWQVTRGLNSAKSQGSQMNTGYQVNKVFSTKKSVRGLR